MNNDFWGHSWGDSPMIFTRDFVTRENHWQIASLVTQKSLFTVTHALFFISWWRHDMEMLSTLLALCEGNPLVASGSPHKGSAMQKDLMFSLMLAWTSCHTVNLRVIWDAMALMWHHCNNLSLLLNWHWGNHLIAPALVKQPWRIWINKSHETTNDIYDHYKTNHNKTVCMIFRMYCISIIQIDGFVHDCSNSIANALELLQSCTKPSI